MCDIHSGDCGNHTGGRSLSNKILRQGYFWPTMRKDAIDYVKKCEECQRHAPVSHQPAEHIHPIISPWPFMKWGMDNVGPLPRASGNRTYMLAMTDYFSKWIEAEAFLQESTVQRSDRIQQQDTHEQPERMLEEIGANLADELPFVLWSDRTTPKVTTGQTPVSLVYGTEEIIPSRVQIPTYWYVNATEERNQVEMAGSLDTIDEPRTSAQIRMTAYKQTTAMSYNKNVRLRTL
ncbi:uncharacterized protein LOC141641672 [Silene latifolia]|uniref:uncharacterized protein LOC141641672 n=1 Tax=Silene latifolia TaxID=37657 RepID=UPI003D78ADBB